MFETSQCTFYGFIGEDGTFYYSILSILQYISYTMKALASIVKSLPEPIIKLYKTRPYFFPLAELSCYS